MSTAALAEALTAAEAALRRGDAEAAAAATAAGAAACRALAVAGTPPAPPPSRPSGPPTPAARRWPRPSSTGSPAP
ncbi:MAG: hypothetical protein U0229_00580 [Anaeromyxobacter sp.]